MNDVNSSRPRTLAALVCLGAFATVAQVMLMREMLVAFFGNELCIGTILGMWLAGIAAGACMARGLVPRVSLRAEAWTLTVVLILAAAVLPLQALGVRAVRLLLHVPAGEYAPFLSMIGSAFLLCLPAAAAIGLAFPLACDRLERLRAAAEPEPDSASAVSPAYALESLGSMLAGVLLTYLLLSSLTPFRILALGSACALAGAVFVAPRKAVPAALWVVALGLAIWPAALRPLETRATRLRWKAFGLLNEKAGVPIRLVASRDTVYQNLAVLESAGQNSLYGNGNYLFSFPDPYTSEFQVHFVMAQNPGARRVLVLGGNPAADIPELLRYPLTKLVFVDLDPGISQIIEAAAPGSLRAAQTDPRVQIVHRDGPRFVKECNDTFDAVIVNAPEPSTVGANRYYTLEFYVELRRLLAVEGFLYTAVTASERLQSEALPLAASVYQTLRAAFPVVLVTAEERNQFFAGRPEAELSLNPVMLNVRSESAMLQTEHYKAAYLLGLGSLQPERTQETEARLSGVRVPLNMSARPVTCYYNLVLWSHFSGSKIEGLLNRLHRVRPVTAIRWIVSGGFALLIVGLLIRARALARPESAGRGNRLLLGLLLASSGFCGMALEVVLIFVFQSLYGYVYTRIGLIVAVFMAGLVVGGPSGRSMSRGTWYDPWIALAALELTLLLLAFAVPLISDRMALPSLQGWMATAAELVIYVTVALTGWAVGAEYTVVNRLYAHAGSTTGAAAAGTDAWDHAGAALGALFMGVLFVPVFGIAAACILLVSIKVAGMLTVGAAMVSARKTDRTGM